MFEEIVVCLDGSPLGETVLPLANTVALAAKAKLTVVRVIAKRREGNPEETYLLDRARQYGARAKLLFSENPASAIVAELEQGEGAIAAMATQGRTALAETVLGSVTLDVLKKSPRPVIVYHPPTIPGFGPKTIRTIAVALDGSEFSERILPAAVELAKAIAGNLVLFQVLSIGSSLPQSTKASPSDIVESSYLHARASRIRREYGIEPGWEVLHGEAGEAICRQLHGMKGTLLALTSHARSGLSRAILGSVAAACVRNSGVPMLLYWPKA